MYVPVGLLLEVLRVAMNAGVAAIPTAPRGRRRSVGHRYESRNLLIDLLKIVMSVAIGALLGAWRERRRLKQQQQALAQLREEIKQDVRQALAQWRVEELLNAGPDDRPAEPLVVPAEPLVVSGRDEA